MNSHYNSNRLALSIFMMFVCTLFSGCEATIRQMAGGVDRDYQQHMKPSAAVLQKISPKPRWSTTVQPPDISEIVQLGDKTLLSGFRDLQEVGGFYLIQKSVNGPYVAFDMDSGREKWRFNTKIDDGTEYAAIPADEIVFIREKDKKEVVYHALDPETGAQRWNLNVGLIHAINVNPNAAIVVFADYQAGNALYAVNLMNGREKWRMKNAFKGKERLPTAKIRDNELLLVDDNQISLYDLGNGKLRWKSKNLGQMADTSYQVWLDNAVLTPTADGKIIKLNSSGEIVWSAKLNGVPGIINITEGLIYVQVIKADDGKPWDLVCLSMDTGTSVWQRSISVSELHSDLRISDNLLAFTLSKTLEIWNSTSGKLINSIPLPQVKVLKRDIDNVRIYQNHVVVGTEEWVGAFSQKNGKRMWFYEAPFANKYALSEALEEREDALENWLLRTGTPKEQRSQTLNMISRQDQLTFKSPTNQAQRNLDAVMAETGQVLRNRNASQLEHQSAYEQRIHAIDGAIAATKVDIAMSKMNASIDMQLNAWSSILGAVDQVRQIKAQAAILADRFRLVRSFARVPIAKTAQYLTMQQDWYVRPFQWQDGQGVLLVDMKTGGWREIITSPDEGEIKDQFIDIPLSLISSNGALLFTHGIGLNAELWKSDERFLTRRTVQRSVMGYELQTVKLRNTNEYPQFSVAR